MNEEQKTDNKIEIIAPATGGEKEQSQPADESGIEPQSKFHRLLNWYKSNKKITIPVTLLALIVIAAVVPWSRYKVAGLFLKKDFHVQVVDSVAATPVSGADVSIGQVKAVTDGSGKANLRHVSVGDNKILVSKKYYKDGHSLLLVPIQKQKTTPVLQLEATGRQVKISVKNLINHSALEGVDINIADVNAKTDKSGSAVVVLPVGTKTQKATLSLSGYNNSSVTVNVSDQTIQENDFNLTPAGSVYFLSKLSGKIDVVKTNLDGSARQTVLGGTGREDDNNTVLLASRDWKYLALLSKRSGGPDARLYLINASDDSNTLIDTEGSVIINPVGWSDHNFVYTLSRQNVNSWQPNAQALKSYNAETGKVITLDQTKGEGSSLYDFDHENYGQVYEIGKSVIFSKSWSANYGGEGKLTGKQSSIFSVNATGGNPQTLKSFNYTESQSTPVINSIPYQASQIYYQVYENGNGATYYDFSNGKITKIANAENNPNAGISAVVNEFNEYQQNSSTYLLSPSGSLTFWSEPRDGKNTLFVGDSDGENGKQIATLSDYLAYGWYTDDYLLVSKNGSELYVMPKIGPDTQTVKITDYHKPARNFAGYGGGYGGL